MSNPTDPTNPPDPTKPRREQPSTYFVQDRSSEHELRRLMVQDQMITARMGGVLPEQDDPTAFRRILDIGCGSGGWIIEAALAYPTLSLTGIDISQRMIAYARTQAQAQHIADRVEFHVMDALLRLDFPNGYFDLVNIRFGSSFLRTWDWPKLLQEFRRVTRSKGIVRVTDGDIAPQSNSVAQQELCRMIICAMERSGHLFTTESTGVTHQLASTLTLHGYQKVQTKAYAFDFQGGTPDGQDYCETSKYAFQTLRPFLQKYGCDNNDYETLCQQAIEDMQRPDFKVTQNYLTAWGISQAR